MEAVGGWRKLSSEELHYLFISCLNNDMTA
jgi:hypothetical protein